MAVGAGAWVDLVSDAGNAEVGFLGFRFWLGFDVKEGGFHEACSLWISVFWSAGSDTFVIPGVAA